MGPDVHNGFIQIFHKALTFIPPCLRFMAVRRCYSLWIKLPESLVSNLLTKVCSSDWIDRRWEQVGHFRNGQGFPDDEPYPAGSLENCSENPERLILVRRYGYLGFLLKDRLGHL